MEQPTTATRFKALVLIAIMVSSLMVGAAVGHKERVDAQTLVPQVLAGGMSTILRPCLNGFTILVGPPVPGEFLILPGVTMIYMYGIFEGSWVLGGGFPGGVCCTGKICLPVYATLQLVGTSE
jgi:hypothetical protein